MKTNKIFAALLMGLAMVACQPKGEKAAEGAEGAAKTAKDYEPSKALKDSVAYLVGVNFGSFLQSYDFGELNWNQIKKGMEDFLKAKGNPRDEDFGAQFKVDPNRMNDMFNNFLEMRSNQKMLVNQEAGEKFLAANRRKDGVEETPSGLQYMILDPGNELAKAASSQDTVWVHYKGTLLDGTVFDEVKEEDEAVHFVLDRVIKGWTEGLQYVGEGGRIKLFIPSELAYGARAPQNIGPNQTLIFDVTVDKVSRFVPSGDK